MQAHAEYVFDPVAVRDPRREMQGKLQGSMGRNQQVRALRQRRDLEPFGDPAHFPDAGLQEIRRLGVCALDLPLPESPELAQLCERVLADLSKRSHCGRDAEDMHMSSRTLYRRFLRETGITFARWKQQARLLEAIRRLADGASVTETALDLGYESTSAFSAMFRRSLGATPRTFIARWSNIPGREER